MPGSLLKCISQCKQYGFTECCTYKCNPLGSFGVISSLGNDPVHGISSRHRNGRITDLRGKIV